jgi:hypothetical protein
LKLRLLILRLLILRLLKLLLLKLRLLRLLTTTLSTARSLPASSAVDPRTHLSSAISAKCHYLPLGLKTSAVKAISKHYQNIII